VECVPEPDEKLSSHVLDSNANVSVSVLSGASSPPDLSPTAGRDPTATFCAMTVSARAMADGAGMATAPGMDATPVTETAPSAEDPYSHIKCLLDGLPDDLTAEKRACATAFIKSRSNVFSRSEYDIGRTWIISHASVLATTPHFEQQQRHPTIQLPMIHEHIQHMIEHDVIEPAASPWYSNIIMVSKQDGSMRFCVDYRKVNEFIKRNKFPSSKGTSYPRSIPALTP